MTQATFLMPDPGERLPFTGERYTTGVPGDIQNEHYHRYMFALRLCEGLDVLDVASGEGYGAALLAEVARSVVGVDIDEPSVAFAARVYSRTNLSFRTGSALAIPLDDASVDVVISFETIEHLVDHAAFMREVKRVLRPGGIFVVSTPDKRVYSEEPGYHNPFHLHELSRREFSDILAAEFPKVRMFEQQVLAGSVIAAVESEAGGVESFATTDSWTFMREARLPNAPYLVAVAAADTASLPAVSFLHGLRTDTAAAPTPAPATPGPWASTEGEALRAEIADLRGQLLDANLEAGKAKCQFLEMDHERGFLRAMLTSARRLADQARADLVHAREELARAREEIIEARERVEAIKDEVRTAIADAEVRIAGDFRRSTSWRVTRPLRGLRIVARRVLRRAA